MNKRVLYSAAFAATALLSTTPVLASASYVGTPTSALMTAPAAAGFDADACKSWYSIFSKQTAWTNEDVLKAESYQAAINRDPATAYNALLEAKFGGTTEEKTKNAIAAIINTDLVVSDELTIKPAAAKSNYYVKAVASAASAFLTDVTALGENTTTSNQAVLEAMIKATGKTAATVQFNEGVVEYKTANYTNLVIAEKLATAWGNSKSKTFPQSVKNKIKETSANLDNVSMPALLAEVTPVLERAQTEAKTYWKTNEELVSALIAGYNNLTEYAESTTELKYADYSAGLDLAKEYLDAEKTAGIKKLAIYYEQSKLVRTSNMEKLKAQYEDKNFLEARGTNIFNDIMALSTSIDGKNKPEDVAALCTEFEGWKKIAGTKLAAKEAALTAQLNAAEKAAKIYDFQEKFDELFNAANENAGQWDVEEDYQALADFCEAYDYLKKGKSTLIDKYNQTAIENIVTARAAIDKAKKLFASIDGVGVTAANYGKFKDVYKATKDNANLLGYLDQLYGNFNTAWGTAKNYKRVELEIDMADNWWASFVKEDKNDATKNSPYTKLKNIKNNDERDYDDVMAVATTYYNAANLEGFSVKKLGLDYGSEADYLGTFGAEGNSGQTFAKLIERKAEGEVASNLETWLKFGAIKNSRAYTGAVAAMKGHKAYEAYEQLVENPDLSAVLTEKALTELYKTYKAAQDSISNIGKKSIYKFTGYKHDTAAKFYAVINAKSDDKTTIDATIIDQLKKNESGIKTELTALQNAVKAISWMTKKDEDNNVDNLKVLQLVANENAVLTGADYETISELLTYVNKNKAQAAYLENAKTLLAAALDKSGLDYLDIDYYTFYSTNRNHTGLTTERLDKIPTSIKAVSEKLAADSKGKNVYFQFATKTKKFDVSTLPANVVVLDNNEKFVEENGYAMYHAKELVLNTAYEYAYSNYILVDKLIIKKDNGKAVQSKFSVANKVSSVYLPFNLTEDHIAELKAQGVTLYYVGGVLENDDENGDATITFGCKVKKEAADAYKPYLVKGAMPESGELVLTNVVLTPKTGKGNTYKVDASNTYTFSSNNFQFKVNEANVEGDAQYILMPNSSAQSGTFAQLYNPADDDDTEWVPAGTLLMTIKGGVEPVKSFRIVVEGEEDEATAISTVNAALESGEGIYTIGGQKLNTINKPGLYIVNGKKVVVK